VRPADRDIFAVIYNTLVGFKRLNMEPPQAIILKSHEDGMRVLCAAMEARHLVYTPGGLPAKPVEHPDGSVWMELQLMGVAIRWPGNRYATESGYVWG